MNYAKAKRVARRSATARARQRRNRKYTIHGTYDARIEPRRLMRDEAKMRHAVRSYRDELNAMEQLNEAY